MNAIPNRRATLQDLDEVFRSRSSRTDQELQAFGLTPDEGRRMTERWLSTTGATALIHNGRPIAIFGSFPKNDAEETWFIGIEEFFQRQHLRSTHAFMVDLLRTHPGKRFRSTSPLKGSEVARWFRFLGFVETGTDRKGNRIFELSA